MGPLASKLIRVVRRLRRDHPVAGCLEALRSQGDVARAASVDLSLRRLEAPHALYAYVQNRVSELSEQVTALAVLRPFVDLIGPAEEEYMPSGPPMSPLTTSYFTSWAFFDVAVGPSRETIGSCLIDLLREQGAAADFLRVLQSMQDSRMGLYVHAGRDRRCVALREIFTGRVLRATVASRYVGTPGEVWLLRVLPGAPEEVVFSTPYVMRGYGEAEWRSYLDRTVGAGPDRHETLMKFGPTPRYWTEYVFEAYVGHESDAVFLTGLPDVEKSRPHSRANR